MKLADFKPHPAAALVPPMRPDEYRALLADVREHGIKVPLEVLGDVVLDGRHRLRAARELGLPGVPTREVRLCGEGAADYVLKAAVLRRQLTDDQRKMMAAMLAQQNPKPQGAAAHHNSHPTGVEVETGKNAKHPALAAAAREVNVPITGAVKAAEVLRKAPELAGQVHAGELALKEAIRQVEVASYPKEAPPLPEGKFRCIVVDPPWPMKKIARDVRPYQGAMGYPMLDVDKIAALDVPRLAADNCHLYLWTTQKHLPDALRIVAGWGFGYECCLAWVKNVGFTPYSWMYDVEPCLFARRGRLPLLKLGLRLSIHAKRREHSHKPEKFYDRVREASPAPRIDLFAREPREGFETWGKETQRFAAVATGT